VTALLVGLGSLLVPGQADARGTCHPRGSETAAQNEVGRFYTYQASYWYCAFKRRRPHQLAPIEKYNYYFDTLAGRHFGFALWVNGAFDSVQVIDMVAGKRIFRAPPAGPEPPDGGIDPEVRSLVLKRDGSIAWIATNWAEVPEVRRHDKAGSALVDSGTAIDPGSLGLGGSRIYWMRGGSARWATLR